MLGWWWHLTGSNGALGWFFSVSGRWYGPWSGFLSCCGMFAAIWLWYRKNNCHTRWCWRFGHHPYEMDGTTYSLCKHHHPTARKRLHHRHILFHHTQSTT